MEKQRLTVRIETIQQKEDAAKSKDGQGSGWGTSFFGGNAQTQKNLEEAQEANQVLQEELEAKISENMHVHELNFELKQNLSKMEDEMQEMK